MSRSTEAGASGGSEVDWVWLRARLTKHRGTRTASPPVIPHIGASVQCRDDRLCLFVRASERDPTVLMFTATELQTWCWKLNTDTGMDAGYHEFDPSEMWGVSTGTSVETGWSEAPSHLYCLPHAIVKVTIRASMLHVLCIKPTFHSKFFIEGSLLSIKIHHRTHSV